MALPHLFTTSAARRGGLAAVLTTVALVAAGCSGGAETTADLDDPGETGFDVSSVQQVDELVALLPADVKEAGVLANGASTDYAPGEYKKADGQTPTGYDVDLVNALAATLGLKASTTHAEFDSLLPQIGSKFTIGASSFTITPDRLEQMTMISYLRAGFQFATGQGNPSNFDPTQLCGHTIGVQTGTAQLEWLEGEAQVCVDNGEPAIDIKPLKTQTEVSTHVASGQYDALVADSPVVGYISRISGGKIEPVGEVFESALHGIAVPKDQPELAEALRAALQHLMDDGTYGKILAHYGAESGKLDQAVINPDVEDAS